MDFPIMNQGAPCGGSGSSVWCSTYVRDAAATYLDGQERLLGVAGVGIEEAREELQVPEAHVLAVEVGFGQTAEKRRKRGKIVIAGKVKRRKAGGGQLSVDAWRAEAARRTAVQHHLGARRAGVDAALDRLEGLRIRDVPVEAVE